MNTFFSGFWYAENMARPMNLTILSASLESLKKLWYENVELNPETVLMDKKEFKKRIKPVKELIAKQFADTDFEERMKRSVDNLNRMSVNEQLAYFFDKIGVVLGMSEKDAMNARNFSAHGSFKNDENNFYDIIVKSQLYEGIVYRVILALIGYKGKYIDYGSIGYPLKDVSEPGGC